MVWKFNQETRLNARAGFVNYSRGNAKLRWMNEQRPKVGGKTVAVGKLIRWHRWVHTEELKTSVVMHGHMRAEKVGPATVANHFGISISFRSPRAKDPVRNKGRSNWNMQQ